MTRRVTKAALAAANATMLPTAAPRRVNNYRYADQRRASRAAREASPFHARYLAPYDREADRLAEEITAIKQTPELLILSAILRTMEAEQATRVLEQLAPGSVAGHEEHRQAHRQALAVYRVSRMAAMRGSVHQVAPRLKPIPK